MDSSVLADIKLRLKWEHYLTQWTCGIGRWSVSDLETVGTEGAAKRKHVLSWTLSINVTWPPAEYTFCTLRASQLANSSLASRWIYSVVIPTLGTGQWRGEVYARADLLLSSRLRPDHVVRHAYTDRHLAAGVLPTPPARQPPTPPTATPGLAAWAPRRLARIWL